MRKTINLFLVFYVLGTLLSLDLYAQAKLPQSTINMADGLITAMGLEPSRTMVVRRAPIARAMPMRVAGSMDQRSSRLGNGTTEEFPAASAGSCSDTAERYSPRSIS